MQTILIVDDDIAVGDLEKEVLERAGYSVLRAYSGTEALLLLQSVRPNLILLDLMLPGLCGEEVLRQIKDIPVIAVSAKCAASDKVELLSGGAVDYITKPFDTEELLARTALRIKEHSALPCCDFCTYKDLMLDYTTHTARVADRSAALTRTEFAILKLLMQNPNAVIAKSVLLDHISADTPDCTESSLKTHISHLRAKLRGISEKEYVESVWGIGFKLR